MNHLDFPVYTRSIKIIVPTVTATKKMRLKIIKNAVPTPDKKILFIKTPDHKYSDSFK
jgi:hypothetical protein